MIVFDGVWLDDRRRCTWAICDLHLEIPDGQVVAFVAPRDQGGPEGVVDLALGRRRPTAGRFWSHSHEVAGVSVCAGEETVIFADGTTLVAWPGPDALRGADLVVRFDGGFEVDRLARLPEGVPAA